MKLLYIHFICWCSSLHFSVVCSCFFFTFSFWHHTSPFGGLSPGLYPFYTYSPAHHRKIRNTFIFNHSKIFFLLALQWAFFTHMCFSPYAPLPTFFTQPAFINASLGAGSSSLKFAGPPTEVRNTEQIQPTCLFESYSVQQKLRVSRFYLSIMATRVCEESVPSW